MRRDLISIKDAVERKITKLRLERWCNPKDYIEIYLTPEGWIGPWIKLWSDSNLICGYPNPHKLMITQFDQNKKEWLAYQPASANGRPSDFDSEDSCSTREAGAS